jgi:16S rRNA (cytosine967-C5)-methyltransferase
MRAPAQVSAAIEVLEALDARSRPAGDAIKEWGLAHRFAGSGDRAAISSYVFDSLRRRNSAAFLMGSEAPRAIVLGMLRLARNLDTGAIEKLFDGSQHAPAPLSEDERARLAGADLAGAPPHVRGDYPEWLDAQLAETFGDTRAEEGAALAHRAPLDLRVNSLKSDREKILKELSHLNPQPARWSPLGIRIALSAEGRQPPVTSEGSFMKGGFEVQDEGSQLAALLSGAAPGMQVLDFCAGSGGKTLAMASMMDRRGQIFAYDSDLRRLAPIHDRLKRAGAHNVQVRAPKGKQDVLSDLRGKINLVMLDAPCTGTGVWRRHPEANAPRRAGAAHERTVRAAGSGGRLRETRRPHCLCHLLGAAGGEQRADPRIPQARARLERDAPERSGSVARRTRTGSEGRGPCQR